MQNRALKGFLEEEDDWAVWGAWGPGERKGRVCSETPRTWGHGPMGAGSLGRKGSAHLGAASGRRGSSSAASVLYRGLLSLRLHAPDVD